MLLGLTYPKAHRESLGEGHRYWDLVMLPPVFDVVSDVRFQRFRWGHFELIPTSTIWATAGTSNRLSEELQQEPVDGI